MGIDYYNCVCGEIHGDCEPMYFCSNCEQQVFNCCYDEQVKKYGKIGEEDKDELGRILINQYGSDALKRCDNCIEEESVPIEVKIRNSSEGDWVELWINNEKELEGHRLSPKEVLEALKKTGIDINIFEEEFDPE